MKILIPLKSQDMPSEKPFFLAERERRITWCYGGYLLTLKDRAPIRTLSDWGGRILEPTPLSRKLL